MPNDYYLKQKDKLLGKHRQMMAIGKPMLGQRFESDFVEALIEEAINEFKKLLPAVPYIGGK